MLTMGCASHHGPGTDDSLATLSIDPPTSELLILNNTPATESFTATLTYPDGTKRDVTADTHFAIDSSYGMFAQNTLSATGAGKTVAYAALADKIANAQVIVRLKDVRIDPALPANVVDWFTGPQDTSRAPHVVYPPKNVVMPRNLGDFEIHWTDANANNVFELSLKSEFSDVRVYVPGGNGDVAAGAGASWSAFLADEWLAAVGNETNIAYEVRGVQSTNPVSVGTAGPELVKLSNEPMLGGLYYWASRAAAGPAGIFRHDVSKPGLPAEQYMTTAQTGDRCVACHVLSRDGTKMAVTYDGGNGAATLVDVATRTPQGGTNLWNFGAFTPDGSQFLSVSAGTLVVRNYADQTVLATMPAAGWVTHPDLAPDGQHLTYVHPNGPAADWTFTGGQIFTRTY
ncbi:MAG: tolB protein precursor, partial [Myxococcales bacterium]|nr:tolB protein precursor [Myxococcales bacterium]